MDILNVPFGYIIKFCYMIIPNYALALLLFALIMKVVLLPLGIKQQKNMIKQASLRPKEAAIRKRYAGRDDKATQQKMQEEIMEFYKKENYNPMGNCLPMLLQFPIIISLFGVINNPLTYICRLGKDNIAAIKDKLIEIGVLAADAVVANEINLIHMIKDNFAALGDAVGSLKLTDIPNFNLIGDKFDLSQIPSFNFDDTSRLWLFAIPVLTFLASFFSMRLTQKFTYQPPTDNSGANTALSMKIMNLTMPLFSVWITFSVPAIVGIYWIYQNVLGFVQQMILAKSIPIPVFTEDDFKNAEREMNGSIRREKKKEKPKSLHSIDDDDEVEKEPKNLPPQKREPEKAITPATLKEDRDGNVPEEKKPDDGDGEKEKKPKPKSLHHDD